MTKYCIDCRHSNEGFAHFWCEHPNFGVWLDSGKYQEALCKSTRNRADLCGEDAKWFDPKPTLLQKVIPIFKSAPTTQKGT